MFSFFTAQPEREQCVVEEQLLLIVEQALLYESRHIATSDRWRKFGMLHHELLLQYEFHRRQQHMLRAFHEQRAQHVYARMQRIIHLFECYKLLKSAQLEQLELRLRLMEQQLAAVHEQFMFREQQRYDAATDEAFFDAIYDEMMPIVAFVNDVYA